MALNATTLKNDLKPEIEVQIRAFFELDPEESYPQLVKFCEAMATAISTKVVNHIQSAAALNSATATGGTFEGTVAGAVCTITIPNLSVAGGVN